MDCKCSVGAILNLDCNVGKQKNNVMIDIDELPLRELELLRIRSNIGVEYMNDICKNHRCKFISDFSNNYRKCLDPLGVHKKIVKTSLQEVTLEEYKQFCENYPNILPGKKLCFRCRIQLFLKRDEGVENMVQEKELPMELDIVSFETANDLVNQCLESLDCSPLKVAQSDRKLAVGKRKIQDFTTKFTDAVSIALTEPKLALNTDKCENCIKLINSIKEKYENSDKERKVQQLTLVTDD